MLCTLRPGEAFLFMGFVLPFAGLEELVHVLLQVDQHVETLRINCRGHEDAVIAETLARKALRPKHVKLVGLDTDSSPSAMAAFLATEQHSMLQHVERLTFSGSFPNDLPQVSKERHSSGDTGCPSTGLFSMPVMLVCLVLNPLCCQQTAAQDVFVSMPLLAHLEIEPPKLSGHCAATLAAARLDTLRSLHVRMDLCHASFLQGCTQLKALALETINVKGVSALAQLTGLTELKLYSESTSRLFSAEEQSELGSTLAALSNLQSVDLNHAPPGPVTQSLSQLTGLTKLRLEEQRKVSNPGSLVLPSCVELLLLPSGTCVQHLASIEAPQLQHLNVTLAVQPSELGALRELCRGVLRACSCLPLNLHTWSKEDTVALMAVLSRDWQPSAEALQPIRSSSIDSYQFPREWTLELWYAPLTRQCLELLPKGLAILYLRWVPWLYAKSYVWPT
jgi:hypothetical protein